MEPRCRNAESAESVKPLTLYDYMVLTSSHSLRDEKCRVEAVKVHKETCQKSSSPNPDERGHAVRILTLRAVRPLLGSLSRFTALGPLPLRSGSAIPQGCFAP